MSHDSSNCLGRKKKKKMEENNTSRNNWSCCLYRRGEMSSFFSVVWTSIENAKLIEKKKRSSSDEINLESHEVDARLMMIPVDITRLPLGFSLIGFLMKPTHTMMMMYYQKVYISPPLECLILFFKNKNITSGYTLRGCIIIWAGLYSRECDTNVCWFLRLLFR
jgi:hypothetical protein